MLYNLFAPLGGDFIFFNLFRYLTFRTGCATLTAFILCLWLGPGMIRWLKSKQAEGQPIRADGPETHFKKAGTPTMGGMMILIAVTASTLLWTDLRNPYMWYVLLVMLAFGGIGFVDDYMKLTRHNTKGMPGRAKLAVQFVFGAIATVGIMHATPAGISSAVAIPFFKNIFVDIGWLFIPWALLVMIGASNAVNLTDGLDGLAIVPSAIVAACFGLISYLVGNAVFSGYLHIPFVPGAGELAIICGAMVGAGMGFLWFNAAPAQVFMGDTGSLSIGGLLGAVAVATKHELVLAIVGGLFVIETLSVIIQVVSFKTRGKRVFKMAPIHHHFEKSGWPETTVVVRFWIIAMVFALIGLSTLKLR